MSNQEPDIHILGVRHHGPGSARSLLEALELRKPDCVLIEGPSDLTSMIPYLGREGLEPPLALVSYLPEEPGRASYFPFAVFSPEYQALRFALHEDIPVRFFDLPQSHMMAAGVPPAMPSSDPMMLIAKAAGHHHYERWWNALVEERRDSADMFEALLELMQALRETDVPLSFEDSDTDAPSPLAGLDPKGLSQEELLEKLKEDKAIKQQRSLRLAEQREAHMRQDIRKAIKEGYKNIAVIIGAFHGPALVDLENKHTEEADAKILANMPTVNVDAAWVPWSYGRMSAKKGYGAGILSAGWYHHLWEQGQKSKTATEFSAVWLTKVAEFLRQEGFTVSSAHIIETVRLAEALSALREQSYPGLPELMEATQTVMCAGNPHPLRLIQDKLIISERMGTVPPDMPMVPLQKDLRKQQLELKLKASLEKSILRLDVRHELHLKRSQLLHRLRLLGIPWGEAQSLRGKKGSFREGWVLEWKPELELKVIEANRYGNTIFDAATELAKEHSQKAERVDQLSQLLDVCLLADLQDVIPTLLERITDLSSSSSDIDRLMKALGPLVRAGQYGNVRQYEQGLLDKVVSTLITRITLQLPKAVLNLRDDAAQDRCALIVQTDSLIVSQRQTEPLEAWFKTLKTIVEQEQSHGLIRGKLGRLLLTAKQVSHKEAQESLERNLFARPIRQATSEELIDTSFFIQGFFEGSAMSLIHDDEFWQSLDNWVLAVEESSFLDILPLLRRSFSNFSDYSRQQLQDKARLKEEHTQKAEPNFNAEQAKKVLPYIAQLIGVDKLAEPEFKN